MEERDSPYVFREEPKPERQRDPDPDADDEEVVIIDGEAMTYRDYRDENRRDRAGTAPVEP